MRETGRKLIHISAGIFMLICLNIFGPNSFLVIFFPLLLLGLLMVQFENQRFKVPVISSVFELFERREVMPGKGALWYGITVISSVAFLPLEVAKLVIICLSIGDGFATLIGRNGRFRNPLNRLKTLEGTVSFIFSALIASSLFQMYSPTAVFFIVVAAVAESLEIYLDDNIRIFFVGLFFSLFLF